MPDEPRRHDCIGDANKTSTVAHVVVSVSSVTLMISMATDIRTRTTNAATADHMIANRRSIPSISVTIAAVIVPPSSPTSMSAHCQLGKSTELARPTWFTRESVLTSQSKLTDGARSGPSWPSIARARVGHVLSAGLTGLEPLTASLSDRLRLRVQRADR